MPCPELTMKYVKTIYLHKQNQFDEIRNQILIAINYVGNNNEEGRSPQDPEPPSKAPNLSSMRS